MQTSMEQDLKPTNENRWWPNLAQIIKNNQVKATNRESFMAVI